MSVEIEATDVIKVILQFCKENDLQNTFQALQSECGVTLNVVDDVSEFVREIKQGCWDKVLLQVSNLKIPVKKLEALHEHIFLEMVELREVEAARALLHQSEVLNRVRKSDPEKYMELEKCCNRTIIDVKQLYNGISRQKRRNEIAKSLEAEVQSVPPSRLMVLIGQAIKWQKQEGLIPPNSSFDVFSGQVPPTVDDEDIFPTKDDVSIKFGAKSYPECALFFPDGSALITGSADGFIEVWDVWNGNLKLDLPYQAAEKFMMHDAPVLSMTMTADGDLLASGSQDGQIKIWRVKSGQCLRKFDAAHSDGVTSLMFSSEKSKVLSSSFDGTIRIHGIKSGKMLKEFRGHESFVNSAAFSASEDIVLSSSSDCSVRLWNVGSSECIAILRPPETPNGLLSPVGNAVYIAGSTDRILIHQTSNVAYIMTLKGEILQSFTLKESLGNIKACCESNHGEYIMCLTDIGHLVCFRASSGKFEQSMKAFTRNAIGMVLHPTRNILAAFSEEGILKIFKA